MSEGDRLLEELACREQAWRWVCSWLATELGVSESAVSWAAEELAAVAAVAVLPANVRSHQRNRIRSVMFGLRPLSGGRKGADSATSTLRRVRLE